MTVALTLTSAAGRSLRLYDGADRERNRVGRFVAKMKPFRRAASRYEKLKAIFAGFLQLVFAFIKARATVNTA